MFYNLLVHQKHVKTMLTTTVLFNKSQKCLQIRLTESQIKRIINLGAARTSATRDHKLNKS